jgi:mannosyl-oligosaccharide alpha-1,2-mannosidase
LWLMGLADEFEEATNWVSESLDFARANREVSVFEVIIRALGGLLGAYELSGYKVFLDRAVDLADRLLPAFNTTSGMPLPRWDLAKKRGSYSAEPTILAEAGSVQLELRTLTALTGDLRYREAADRSTEAIWSTGMSGLVPVHLTPPGELPVQPASDAKYALGALADSYYEYLLKQWVQSPTETHFRQKWLDLMEELPQLVRGGDTHHKAKKRSKLRLIEMEASGRVIWKQDHLSCFVPGMIALGLRASPESNETSFYQRGLEMAKGLTEGCVELWTTTATGLAPEFAPILDEEPFKLDKIPNDGAHSFLRPETAESLFYMYRLTGDVRYRRQGKKLFAALVRHSKVDAGFATVTDVRLEAPHHRDEMQSFVLAETLKYLYLLFAPENVLDLNQHVLNTEGHPLPRFVPR